MIYIIIHQLKQKHPELNITYLAISISQILCPDLNIKRLKNKSEEGIFAPIFTIQLTRYVSTSFFNVQR